jgi:hypothetical protein
MSDIVSASRDAKHAKTWPFERNHAERARRRGGSAAWRRGWRGPLAFGVLTASLVALSPVAARAATAPSPTIAGAQAIQIGDVEQDAVGNEATDFWSVALNGGDQLAIDVTDDSVSTDGYRFELYDPTATDANFATAQWVTARTIAGSDSSQITIQAPHTGTFILAVCETPAEGTAGS